MYHHTITFHSLANFGLFSHEVSASWKNSAVFCDARLDDGVKVCAVYSSDSPIDKECRIDIQASPHVAETVFNLSDDLSPQEEHKDDDISVPCDSLLWQDVAQLVSRYFPGSTVTSIESTCSIGEWFGAYSVLLKVQVTHPTVCQVEIRFIDEDVPGRPSTWEELVSLSGISLFLSRITLVNCIPNAGPTITYDAIGGMYQKEIEAWCKSHGDRSHLYHYVETPDLFIITPDWIDEGILRRAVIDTELATRGQDGPGSSVYLLTPSEDAPF